jgi:hypothetical protein
MVDNRLLEALMQPSFKVAALAVLKMSDTILKDTKMTDEGRQGLSSPQRLHQMH